jgi:hypothetical protein
MRRKMLVLLLCLLTSLFLFEAEEGRKNEKVNYDYAVGNATIGKDNKGILHIISYVWGQNFFPEDPNSYSSYEWQKDFLIDMKKRNKRVELFYQNKKIATAKIKNVEDSGCGDVWADLEVHRKSTKQLRCTGIIALNKQFKVKETYTEINCARDEYEDLRNWALDYCTNEAIEYMKQWISSSGKKPQEEIVKSDLFIDKDKISIKGFHLNKTKSDLYIVSTPYFKCSKKVVDLFLPNWDLETFSIGWFVVVEIKDGQKKVLHSEKQEVQYNEIILIDLCDFDGDEIPELVFEVGDLDGYSLIIYKILEKEFKVVGKFWFSC